MIDHIPSLRSEWCRFFDEHLSEPMPGMDEPAGTGAGAVRNSHRSFTVTGPDQNEARTVRGPTATAGQAVRCRKAHCQPRTLENAYCRHRGTHNWPPVPAWVVLTTSSHLICQRRKPIGYPRVCLQLGLSHDSVRATTGGSLQLSSLHELIGL